MIEHDGGHDSIQDQMINQLEAWAFEHAKNSNGLLEVIPRDDKRFPQKLERHIKGEAKSHETTDMIAGMASPYYAAMKESVRKAEHGHKEVSRLGEMLAAGNNILLITNHTDLVDIALAQVAVYGELDRLGYEVRTGIIISEMISFLRYKIGDTHMPAVETLQMVSDDIFLSYPATRSNGSHMRSGNDKTTRLAISTRMKAHNRLMRAGINKSLNKGGMLLAVAPSGTTDKAEWNDLNRIHLAKVGAGTSEILSGPGNFVLPIALAYGEGQPTVFEFTSVPQVLPNPDDVHDGMHLIAETLSEHVPGKEFIYDHRA